MYEYFARFFIDGKFSNQLISDSVDDILLFIEKCIDYTFYESSIVDNELTLYLDSRYNTKEMIKNHNLKIAISCCNNDNLILLQNSLFYKIELNNITTQLIQSNI